MATTSVVESNCVVARRGGEQQETKDQSVGDELDSVTLNGEPFECKVKPRNS